MAVLDHEHLLDQAELLIQQRRPGPPRQADIRRAISASYYALFHFVMTQAADMVVGSTKRREARYSVVYRSVDHSQLKSLCQGVRSARPDLRFAAMTPKQGFGDMMKHFAAVALELQEKRHAADYESDGLSRPSDALAAIAGARAALESYQAAPAEERLAFLTLLLFKRR
jgi:hypothetical protein